jgi:hypothetical protein
MKQMINFNILRNVRDTQISLWRVEPLLYNDHKMGGYTRPISVQQLGKHVPRATNLRATMVVLLETRCVCVVRAEM